MTIKGLKRMNGEHLVTAAALVDVIQCFKKWQDRRTSTYVNYVLVEQA